MPGKELTTVASKPREDDGAIQVVVTLPARPSRRESAKCEQPDPVSDVGSRPRIPRITRLMALAIKFQDMVDRGEVRDYADIARLGYVSRARLTQIMNLLLLAPDIQEEIVGLGSTTDQRILAERHTRSVVKFVLWDRQRDAWRQKSELNAAFYAEGGE